MTASNPERDVTSSNDVEWDHGDQRAHVICGADPIALNNMGTVGNGILVQSEVHVDTSATSAR